MILWTLIGSLGLGGIATAAGLFFFPTITLQILSGAATIVIDLARKALAKFFSGCEWIFQRKDATFALFVFMIAAGFIADRYDPVRTVVTWKPGVKSAPAPPKSTPQRQATPQRQSRPVIDAFDYVCKSMGAC